MGDHAALLLTSYETATFGDSFFGGMAAAERDTERREKLLLLQEITSRMAAWLLPLLERMSGLEFAGYSDVSRAALTRYLETVR